MKPDSDQMPEAVILTPSHKHLRTDKDQTEGLREGGMEQQLKLV